MKQILEYIEQVFKREEQKNLKNYAVEHLSFTQKAHTWQPYSSEGYIDKVLQIPYDYFMTVEYCIPTQENGYVLSTYSPCPLPVSQKTYLLENNNEDDNLHRHDYFEMIYVYKGTRTTQIENQTIHLTEHDICIFDTQCAHLDIRSKSEGIAFYCCITSKMLDSYFLNHLTNKSIRNFFLIKGTAKSDVSYLKLHAVPEPAKDIEENLAFIFREMESTKPGYERIAQIHTLRILNAFERSDTTDIYTFSKRLQGNKLFQAVARYIDSHIADISLEKLCDHFHYQADYYGRLIKKNTGLNYAQYVHALKMEKAKNLLVNTDMSVSEILIYLGYQYHSYFYKSFQLETGMSPSEYRKAKRVKPPD
ncbi:MAG: helix-turn-helix domain-containing protein [Clostridium sp.]|nr:helix-turn-helix domain-containing protein [Clostridium sp.]